MRASTSVLAELALDALALRVIAALEAAGVPVLLMKGPVTRSWLYADTGGHPYTDVDLLVAPDHDAAAAGVLRGLGLRDLHAEVLGLYRPPCERAWGGPEGVVDLHVGLMGVPSARWSEAWHGFAAAAEEFVLHGRAVQVMDERARALHVVLHAAQRASGPKALADLTAAIDQAPRTVWEGAAALAEGLGAGPAFTAGLDRDPAGRALLAELPIRRSATVGSVLQARGARSEALALVAAVERRTPLRVLLGVEDPVVPRRRVLRLRLAAAARLPVAVVQLLGAAAAVARGRRRPGGDPS